MGKWSYTKGLHDLGGGIYAYLQPDGSWGWSNAGLVVDGGASLLVDTLFDLELTKEMLAEMRKATDAAASIDILVNTHANGDHCYGNELVKGAEIIASRACEEEMGHSPAQMLAQLNRAAPGMGELGAYFLKCFGKFNFEGITPTPPTRTFEGSLSLKVGAKEVRLIEVGPAHTRGDILVHIPENGTVFAGDILFIGGTPIMWTGPVANWINACNVILEMDAETIIPGHGPITDKNGVIAVKGYFEHLRAEARRRYDAGMTAADAARDIDLSSYRSWTDAERIIVNIDTLYREFSGDRSPTNALDLFTAMADLAKSIDGG